MFAKWLALTVLSLSSTGHAATLDLKFIGACDGSAAAALDDGGIAVGDDEHSTLHVYGRDGGSPVERDRRAFLGFAPGDKDESDLEGAARLGRRIYWIGSHGRNKNGKPKPERQVLFATTSDRELSPVGAPVHTVLTTLLAESISGNLSKAPTPSSRAIQQLNLSALDQKALAPELGGINIEAIAAGPDGTLLLGFRSPRAGPGASDKDARALIIPLLNPADLVDVGATPRFGTPIAIDLSGLGVRDMVRRADGSYAIIAGPTDDSVHFKMFTWQGPGGGAPVPLTVDLRGLRPEAVIESDGRLLVLSDDGDDICKAANTPARAFAGRLLP